MRRKWYYLLALTLLLPALLVNLGRVVFIDDEGIRSLVALEMLWSGNFVAPTLHGDAYLNKPPLWNWILALSFTLHGGASEWAARLPTVVALLGFAATTYAFSRRYLGRYLAVVHALTVVTCGRMLFWDSMLALIDVCFSWVVYTQIMVLYHHGRRDRWWWAFGLSYLLTAVGFMLKGLPAIVFQGLTVFAILGWRGAWRPFFRPAHLISGIGCLALLAIYYVRYDDYVSLERVGRRLFVESSKRTAVAQGWGATARHLLAFPFEMAYHFLPWTLLICFLRRGAWRLLRANGFAAFCLLAFAVNIPVYWLSPNVYPRYLLMLFPLLFAPLLLLFQEHARAGTAVFRGLRYLVLGVMTLATVAIFLAPLAPQTAIITYAWPKAVGVGAVAGAMVMRGWKDRGNFLLILACFLLTLRLAFNFFVLPPRAAGKDDGNAVRDTARAVAATTRGDTLLVYRHTHMEPALSYYLSQARGDFVRRSFDPSRRSGVYIVSEQNYPAVEVAAIDSLHLRHSDHRYPVGPFSAPPPTPPADPVELMDGMGSGIPIN